MLGRAGFQPALLFPKCASYDSRYANVSDHEIVIFLRMSGFCAALSWRNDHQSILCRFCFLGAGFGPPLEYSLAKAIAYMK